MIYRRAVARLRAQDWLAISIELAIVVLGVFIGTWVADRNQQRVQQHQVDALVDRLKPTLQQFDQQVEGDIDYYKIAHSYALTAFAGWDRDPRVSDAQFVIAAYQASQVTGFGANSQIFSTLIGADQVRIIDDPDLRNAMGRVFGADFGQLSYQNMLTDYRQHVREIIPNSIQEEIRAQCGDRNTPIGVILLPPKCEIALPRGEVTNAAADLRAHPELVKELDYHLAQASTLVGNIQRYGERARQLMAMIEKRR